MKILLEELSGETIATVSDVESCLHVLKDLMQQDLTFTPESQLWKKLYDHCHDITLYMKQEDKQREHLSLLKELGDGIKKTHPTKYVEITKDCGSDLTEQIKLINDHVALMKQYVDVLLDRSKLDVHHIYQQKLTGLFESIQSIINENENALITNTLCHILNLYDKAHTKEDSMTESHPLVESEDTSDDFVFAESFEDIMKGATNE